MYQALPPIFRAPGNEANAIPVALERGTFSGHTTFNLKGSSISTRVELPCCMPHQVKRWEVFTNFILHDCGFGFNGRPHQVQEYYCMHMELLRIARNFGGCFNLVIW